MDELLPRLDAAVAAATTLGLPVAAAARARDDVAQRGGYPGDLYVWRWRVARVWASRAINARGCD